MTEGRPSAVTDPAFTKIAAPPVVGAFRGLERGEMRGYVREVAGHFAASISYFAVLTAVYCVCHGWRGQLPYLWLGAFIGAEALDVDHLIYIFLTHRNVPTSIEARKLARRGKYGRVLAYIEQYHKDFYPVHLVCHNGIIQIVFCVFTFFMLAASASLFWVGFGLSVLFHLLKDEWEDLRNDPPRLRAYVFRHFPRVPLAAVRLFVFAMTALLILFSALFVFSGR